MRSHTQSVVIEPDRRRITGSISYKPLISDLSVLRVCNKIGGTIKGDKKIAKFAPMIRFCEREIYKIYNTFYNKTALSERNQN